MDALKRYMHAVEKVNIFFGRVMVFVLLLTVFIISYEVVMRYAFNKPTNLGPRVHDAPAWHPLRRLGGVLSLLPGIVAYWLVRYAVSFPMSKMSCWPAAESVADLTVNAPVPVMSVGVEVVSRILGPRKNRGRSLETGPPKKSGEPEVSSTV